MELRVLQYRKSYINETCISELRENVSSSVKLEQRLGLVDVAYVREDRARLSLEFLEGGRDSIWPGKYTAIVAIFTLAVLRFHGTYYRPYS